jgi:hypothetical protein
VSLEPCVREQVLNLNREFSVSRERVWKGELLYSALKQFCP